MSAQGETISRRRPIHVPVQFLVLAMAAVAAAGALAMQSISGNPAERLPATSVERDGAMPVQRLYPEGFGSAAQTGSMPIQRLYPEGFGSVALIGSMPVQRLYPDGFGGPKDGTVVGDRERRTAATYLTQRPSWSPSTPSALPGEVAG
jgi:hypothetical protein